VEQLWLRADGTSVTGSGDHGRWERKGNQVTIDWGKNTDNITISYDGLSIAGTNSRNEKLAGTLIGTNLTGADAPPK
jgi:hypothetical protein